MPPAVPGRIDPTSDHSDAVDHGEHVVRTAAVYDAYHQAVDAGGFGRFLHFMNYGYRDLGEPTRRTFDPPAAMPAADEARLVAEVVGDEVLDGRRILDVGCGRGGSLALVARHHRPRQLVGLDLSRRGLGRARDALRGAAGFVAADACALPLADATVEVVLCVESSLHYADLARFYDEVRRVLQPNGSFRYADFFLADSLDHYDGALERSGFTIAHHRDVTDNVLASRHARAERERLAFGSEQADAADVNRFVGVGGTGFEQALADGTYRYRILHLLATGTPRRGTSPDPALLRAARVAADITATFDLDPTTVAPAPPAPSAPPAPAGDAAR